MQNQRFDESGLRILLHLLDLTFDALDAEPFGKSPQESRVLASVEVIGEVDVRLRRRRELASLRHLQFEAVFANLGLNSELEAAQPEMVELTQPGRLAVAAERMDVAVAV